MARGDDKNTYNQQQKQQFGFNQQVQQQQLQNQQQGRQGLQNRLDTLWNNPGYTDQEKSDIRSATIGGLAGRNDAATAGLTNQAARTGNSAGFVPAMEQMARTQGQQQASDLGQLEDKFATARMNTQQGLVPAYETLYTGATPGLTGAMGNQSSLVGTQASVANTPGFWDRMALAGVQAAGQAATGAFAGGK